MYSLRLCDALETLQLLELPNSRDTLRAKQDSWLTWLAPLRSAPGRDPALELQPLLTIAQPDDQVG
ncbi:MAG: hypothetical protein QM520_04910 [Gammaproteobacteria bacterium]|nr:hypothetical protein [Gammaproteobacteria bacterium]